MKDKKGGQRIQATKPALNKPLSDFQLSENTSLGPLWSLDGYLG